MRSSVKFVLICICLSFFHEINGQMQLIAGHVLYRHGDRTPISTFPSDPVKESDWPNGFGQLTLAGIEQQHYLGQIIRNRYELLLNFTYISSEIVVRSTDVDRTLMSAQSNLVGLYPVLNVTTENVPIQPIPIHTVPVNTDFLLGQSDCPRYDQLVDEVMASDAIKQLNEYYQPFFDKLQVWTNLTNITFFSAWDVADTILVERIYNKTPTWAQDEGVQTNLSRINDLSFHYLFSDNDTQRIRGGPLVQDIWSNMNNSANGASFKKVKMYSAHDTTIGAVLSFLGINYPHQPQYASALFLDLYEQNSTYFVQVKYLNVTDSNISYPYILAGCPGIDCSLDTFTNIYKPRFPASADIECRRQSPMPPPSPSNNGKLITVLVIVIVCLAVMIFVIFLYLYLRKPKRDAVLIRGDPSSEFV